jgi:hypothetical protein
MLNTPVLVYDVKIRRKVLYCHMLNTPVLVYDVKIRRKVLYCHMLNTPVLVYDVMIRRQNPPPNLHIIDKNRGIFNI